LIEINATPAIRRQKWLGKESHMTFHRQILQWQADHPVITWIFWIVVWMLVLLVLLKPTRLGGMI
jgi:hypothetical protein